MKKTLSSLIAIAIEVITIVLAFIWMQRTNEEEPKIVLIVGIGSLLTSLLVRASNRPKITFYLERSAVQSNPTIPNRLTSIISQVGEISGQKIITRTYNLSIVNNSNNIAFNPELYIHRDFQELIFTGNLSASEPISPAGRIELQIKFIKTIEGTRNDFENETRVQFPKEFSTSFRLSLSYQDENEKSYYTTLKIENNSPENRMHTYMERDLVKIKVYKPLF